jgi:hypothetical protein
MTYYEMDWECSTGKLSPLAKKRRKIDETALTALSRSDLCRRIHEGMDRGAVAREKNGANNRAKYDRDNQVPNPILQ